MSLRFVSQTCVINTGCRTFLHEYVVALIGGSFPMSAEFDIAIEYGGGGEALPGGGSQPPTLQPGSLQHRAGPGT